MVTVIPEGNHYEFLGWVSPGFSKYSASRTFMSKLFPRKAYKLHTNLNGGERAYVMSGQYEKVLPMDIYPVHLIKAIITNDIDKMEQAEAFTRWWKRILHYAEYVCTSKIEVQEILRKGIETVIKELG